MLRSHRISPSRARQPDRPGWNCKVLNPLEEDRNTFSKSSLTGASDDLAIELTLKFMKENYN
jgi:hypothetical protein